MGQIFHHDHCSFLVESDSRPGEFHLVEFHELPPHSKGYPETCTCERFTIGIPDLIKRGKLPNTTEHRRCRHIRRVRDALANAAVTTLQKTDPSRPSEPSVRQTTQQPPTRHASQIHTTPTGEKEFTIFG